MATAHRSSLPESLIRKIGALPRARVAEVEDFVEFLSQREQAVADRALARTMAAASAPAFSAVWSNPEDDVYDAL